MRSFFWRIFLWFWLAVALAGIGSFVVVVTLLREDPGIGRWRGLSTAGLAVFAEMAADAYADGGRAGLDRYLDRAEGYGRVRAYLFDVRGRELSGRVPTPEAARLARLLARRREAGPRFSLRALQAGYRVPAQRGQGVRVLVAEIPGGLAGNLFVPALRVFAVILLAGLTCYGLARSFSQPVEKLRAATRRLAAGDLSARVEPSIGRRRDEIGELALDFDRMAARLQAETESRKRLLGDISHELRSPLARLRVALELARQRSGGDALPALERIERETERMNALIGQLLALTRMESDPALRRETVDLNDLITGIAADADFEARRRDAAVPPPVLPDTATLLSGDPDLLRSAIENAVRNAVRYTEPGTTVDLSLAAQGNEALLTVRDHGPGVPPEALPDLFRPFYRVGDARDRESGGAGLGLAIAARAVALHGGAVRAENAPGGGLRIEIRLPLGGG